MGVQLSALSPERKVEEWGEWDHVVKTANSQWNCCTAPSETSTIMAVEEQQRNTITISIAAATGSSGKADRKAGTKENGKDVATKGKSKESKSKQGATQDEAQTTAVKKGASPKPESKGIARRESRGNSFRRVPSGSSNKNRDNEVLFDRDLNKMIDIKMRQVAAV